MVQWQSLIGFLRRACCVLACSATLLLADSIALAQSRKHRAATGVGAAGHSAQRVVELREARRQALLREHLASLELEHQAMPWVGGALALIGIGMATRTLADVDWTPGVRDRWETSAWMVLAAGGGGVLLVPSGYQRPALMGSALSANAVRWSVDVALDDAESSNRVSAHALATGYATASTLTWLTLALGSPPNVARLAAHHRRLSRSRVSPVERATMEKDFATMEARGPCWAKLLPLSVGSLAALLPAVGSRLADGRPVPYWDIALAQLPMSVCFVSTLTNPYRGYYQALSRMKLVPEAAGHLGLTVAFVL